MMSMILMIEFQILTKLDYQRTPRLSIEIRRKSGFLFATEEKWGYECLRYMLVLLLFLLFFFCVVNLHWLDCIIYSINPDLWLTGLNSKSQQVALDHVITLCISQNLSKFKNISFLRKHVVPDFWAIRAILKLLHFFSDHTKIQCGAP